MTSFAALHKAEVPFIIANVWDVPSAHAAAEAGYPALGTSSAAIASMLGYQDGQDMSFEDLFHIVSRIRACSTLPLSVDIEAGYAESAESTAVNAQRLQALGVAGINVEDSLVIEGKRQLLPAEFLAERIAAIKRTCPGLFINARTDTFLLGVPQALQETIARGRLYAEHGADGYFVPCITEPAAMREVSGAVTLPLNVMCMPTLPDFATLGAHGVKRISMGNFVHGKLKQRLGIELARIQAAQSFASLFADEDQ
ncbi:isocitrate lyase/PEP mutase family protein [Massilia sp. SM-13]|uniref:isocitrate lyase/PEP mutase family protein n=1 Tax=Pseudoduganella rhizocola TaxID=3382643 RepID=UPI0038B493B2